MQTKLLIFGTLMAVVLLLGCIGGTPPEPNAPNQTQPEPVVKTPSIAIVSPTAGQVIGITGDKTDVTLSMSTQNLLLKSPGGAAKKGEGHFRITIDNGPAATVTTKTYTMPGLAPGAHTAKVELLNNDRTKYSPAITKEVTFLIEKTTPDVYVPVNYNVSINNLAYEPQETAAKVSDTLTFHNAGSFPMSATCFIGGKQIFDTKVLAPGQTAVVKLGQEMDCTYYSTTQRQVTGRVIVSN
jgi:plastocyanin